MNIHPAAYAPTCSAGDTIRPLPPRERPEPEVVGDGFLGDLAEELLVGVEHRQPGAVELVHPRQQDAQVLVVAGGDPERGDERFAGALLAAQVLASHVAQALALVIHHDQVAPVVLVHQFQRLGHRGLRPGGDQAAVGGVLGAHQEQALERAVLAGEGADELVRRVRQQGIRVVVLEQPAALEYRHLVAQLDGFVDVVADHDHGHAELALHLEELVLDRLAVDRIDRAERLVHQQQRRVRRQRADHPDALLLAAGEFARVALQVLLGLQLDHAHRASRAFSLQRALSQPSRRGTTMMFSSMVMFGNRPICWIT